MDNKVITPDRRDLFLAIGMVLCGFLFWEGGMLSSESALGKAVFISLACITAAAYMRATGIKQSKASLITLSAIVVLIIPFVIYAGRTEHIITMFALGPLYLYWIARSFSQSIDSKLSVYAVGDVIKQSFMTPFMNYESCPEVLINNSRGKGGKGALMVGIGVLLAIPLMAVALILLSQADKSFGTLIDNIIDQLSWKWLRYIGELILGIPVAFYIFGLIYGNAKGRTDESFNKKAMSKAARAMAKLPPLIGATILICLNVIYSIFLGLQIRHVIMGLPKEMTYSEFARQGFFQLCELSMLNLALIVVVSVFKKRNDKATKLTKLQIALMSVLTIGISCTALAKMFMYINVFGLTQKRVWTSTFMIFLIIVFGAIALHQFVRINIGRVVCVTGIIILMLFNFAGVDKTIAKYNIARYREGTLKMMDMKLMVKLDDSALPEIYEVWKKDGDKAVNMEELLRKNRGQYSWADWSIERARANEVRDDFYRNYYCVEDSQNGNKEKE